MPTELEELVEFLHHGNTQIRQVACEHLVGYSHDATVFKSPDLTPVKDLKLLVKDYPPIAKNALTILINTSHDAEVLAHLAGDDVFVETLLQKLTDPRDPHADEVAMLLANLVKSDVLARKLIGGAERAIPPSTTSNRVLDQLVDLFVKGADRTLNPNADFDYLSYVFADLSSLSATAATATPDASKHPTAPTAPTTNRPDGEQSTTTTSGRRYFLTRQTYDGVAPVTKLTVFTEHRSHVRRRGVASTIKNLAFEVSAHPFLLRGSGEVGTAPSTDTSTNAGELDTR